MNRGNKKSHKPVKLMTLDTETRGFFGEIFRVGLFDGEKYYAANTFSRLKHIIARLTKKYDCHVFIHNLDFDLGKMVDDVLYDVDLNDSIFINNNVAVYKTSLVESQMREELEIISQPLTFHDSLKLVANKSLAAICEDFRIESEHAKISLKEHIINLGWARDKNNNPIKHPSEYHKHNSEGYYFMNVDPLEPMLNDYLKNDCISLYHILVKLINMSQLPIEEFLKCPTTASLALKVFKTAYPNDYEKAISTKIYRKEGEGEFYEKFIREGYYGGRTEVFVPKLKNGFHYDVNSLYPYIMKEHKFPVGRPTYLEGHKAKLMFERWKKHQKGAGFIEVDVYVPEDIFIPPLPRKDKSDSKYRSFKKLIFPVGNIHGVYTYDELGLALDMGCEIKKVYQGIHFNKTEYIFKDFITYFEKIKIESSGALKAFAKLMQNSLYGKFGMIRIRETMLPIDKIDICEEKGYPYIIRDNELIKGGKFILAQVPSHAEYIQPHIAAYVTSLARILLYKSIMKQLEKGAVNYCDTDSIACQHPFDEDDIHESEYGKWKLEANVKKGLFIQPKLYYEKHEEKIIKENYEKVAVSSFSRKLFNMPEHIYVKQKYVAHKEVKRAKGVPKKYDYILSEAFYDRLYSKLERLQIKISNNEKITDDDVYFELYGEKMADEKLIKFGTGLKQGIAKEEFNKRIRITKKMNLLNMQKRQMDYAGNTSKPHILKDF
ncbi:DNA polymerase [Bacillus licheniformis]|uniref:DNA polymerase n=1 Tax=Bacillus subtilis group TaxID=653685 RepID=UPI0011EE0ABF|nr:MULTISPECIES: DNA polymerase [Bacillus subtilis group]KAA0817065.1 DNA polymerase [Bacillus licheniformis]KAA0829964.1 DNA polymerase [Bacillus licheniformis]KAA0835320.1 DNA polymerase [Bacillus paralicheniformis]KAA0844476.1 DNA polymerase [Bacillus licheniformis]